MNTICLQYEGRNVVKNGYTLLHARPIMIYPASEEQRERIVAAAEAETSKLSPFILRVLEDYLDALQSLDAAKAELASLERRRKELEARIKDHHGKN
jgi:chromosome segregation ATPase